MISLFPIRKYHFRYFAAQSGLTWILVFSGESPNPLPFTLIAGSGAAGKANVLLLFGVKLFEWLDRVGFFTLTYVLPTTNLNVTIILIVSTISFKRNEIST